MAHQQGYVLDTGRDPSLAGSELLNDPKVENYI